MSSESVRSKCAGVTVDWHWFALLTLTVLINVPFLSQELLFSGDVLHAFTFFHFAYSEILLHQDVPRWLPYLGFGTVFDFFLINTIMPSDYVVMAFGFLCGCKNSVLLYKFSLILCLAFFVLGLYQLSRRMFASMLVVWMVCLGGLLGSNGFFVSPWCLTAYYLLPLVLWLLLRFVEDGQPAHLWLAGLTEGLSLLGTVPYVAPLHLFIALAFLMPFLWREAGLWRRFACWRNFVHPLFFLCAGYYLLLALWIAGMNVVFTAPQREADSARVPLKVFLGNEAGFERQPLPVMVGTYVRGDYYRGEMISYAGVLTLLAIPYALLRRRDTLFLGVASASLALLWFAHGSWFATLTYYLVPAMNRFRFISCAWNYQRFFFLLLGGFGLDQLLRDLASPGLPGPAAFSRRTRWLVAVLLACCALDIAVSVKSYDRMEFLVQGPATPNDGSADPPSEGGVLLLAAFLAHAVILGSLWWLCLRLRGTDPAPWSRWTRSVGPVLLALYLADMVPYFCQTARQAPWCPPGTPVAETLVVKQTIYRPQRYLLEKLPPDAAEVRQVLFCPRAGVAVANLHGSAGVLAQADLVLQRERLDVLTPGIKKMMLARVPPNRTPIDAMTDDVALRRSFGEGVDKARLVSSDDVVFAGSAQEALEKFRLLRPDEKIVLEGARPPAAAGQTQRVPASALEPPVEFTANRVVFRLPGGASGWLIYADGYDPAWQARVDGEPIQVYRANLGFKAVQVPPGAQELVFYFDAGQRDWLCTGFVAMLTILSFVLACSPVLAPWMANPRPTDMRYAGPERSSLVPGVLALWAALAWIAALARGLLLFAGFFCPLLLLTMGATLVVFLCHNRPPRQAT